MSLTVQDVTKKSPKQDVQNTGKSPWWRHFENKIEPKITFEDLSVLDFLDRSAKNYPKNKAIIFQNYTLTYGELKKEAETFAAALRLRGVETGDRVAIMLPNIPQTIIAIWGVLKAGAVAVMTNPLYMEKELTHHFHDSNATILITLDLLWPKIEKLYDKLGIRLSIVTRIADGLAFPLNFLQPWKAKREGTLPSVDYDNKSIIKWCDFIKTKERYATTIKNPSETLAFLQYTGGTTGVSKAAMLSHANLSSQIQILSYIIDSPKDYKYIFLSILPFFHIFGLGGNVILPAYYAAASIPVPRYTPSDLLHTIDKYRPNFFVGVPSVYMSLMQQKDLPKYDLSCIELCISGSAPFPKDALERFQKLTGARVTEGFGLTEASPCITANPLYGLQKTGSVGVALPGTEVKIVDNEDGVTELGPYEHGEFVVRGPQVMQGYWNKEEETALTLRDGWLYTGDIGYYDDDHYFYVADRKKDMVIVGGYNVYPREVDEVLYEHPSVAEAVVVGIPHRSRGEVLKAFIVPVAGTMLTNSDITSHCRAKLANYKIPKYIEFCEELPKSFVGKVLRRVLREMELNKMEASGELKKINTPLEDFVDEAIEQKHLKAKERSTHMLQQAEDLMAEAKVKAEEMMVETKKKAEELLFEAKKKAESLLEQAKITKEKISEKYEESSEDFSSKIKIEEIVAETKKKAEDLAEGLLEQVKVVKDKFSEKHEDKKDKAKKE